MKIIIEPRKVLTIKNKLDLNISRKAAELKLNSVKSIILSVFFSSHPVKKRKSPTIKGGSEFSISNHIKFSLKTLVF